MTYDATNDRVQIPVDEKELEVVRQIAERNAELLEVVEQDGETLVEVPVPGAMNLLRVLEGEKKLPELCKSLRAGLTQFAERMNGENANG